jgi:hypothetical protein
MQSAIFAGTQMFDCEAGSMHLSAKEKNAEWLIRANFDQTFIRWE